MLTTVFIEGFSAVLSEYSKLNMKTNKGMFINAFRYRNNFDRMRVYMPSFRNGKDSCVLQMSRLMGKPTICIGENKDADQLRGNREADQRLCFRYSDSIIPPLPNSKISSF